VEAMRFQYPFWWNNIVAALDSVSLIGLTPDDEHVREGLQWLKDNQEPTGLWKQSYVLSKTAKAETAAMEKRKPASAWRSVGSSDDSTADPGA
jgi:hypothetical protein